MTGFDAGEISLAFPPDAGFHRATTLNSGKAEAESLLGQHLRVAIRLRDDPNPAAFANAPLSVAEHETFQRAHRQRSVEERVREHPALHQVLQALKGRVEHVEILEPEPVANLAPSGNDIETEADETPDADARSDAATTSGGRP